MATQYCVSCNREVCKLKLGQDQDWKIRLEHYTPEKIGDYTSIESMAMCSDCVNDKKDGYLDYLNGKHFGLDGKLIMTRSQEIEQLQLDIKQLEKEQSDIQRHLDRKRDIITKLSLGDAKK